MINYTTDKYRNRERLSSGAPWESLAGYSRAVKIGNVIEVAGTTAIDEDNEVIGINDIGKQTEFILKKIDRVLKQLGSSMHDVVRTRMYVTDISKWEAVSKAHGRAFGEIKPVATMVEVSKLIAPKLLIEIEVTAVMS